jgi:Na+/H+ antiporter NhaD/arsenite permease-like protein
LIAVPAFKTITHLPPFMGILFGLGILWVVGELIHRGKEPDEKRPLTLVHALKQIDMASIAFFIGILLAVATLEHTHVLGMLAKWLDQNVGRQDVIVVLLGVLSAIVDNVPLVALPWACTIWRNIRLTASYGNSSPIALARVARS